MISLKKARESFGVFLIGDFSEMPCCLSLSLELNSFEILWEKDSSFDYSV